MNTKRGVVSKRTSIAHSWKTESTPVDAVVTMRVNMTSGKARFHEISVALMILVLSTTEISSAFVPLPILCRAKDSVLGSSVGGEGPPPSSGNNGDKNDWDDFLDPNFKESEGLQKAREYMSENSLPISFDEEADDGLLVNDDSNGQAQDIVVDEKKSNVSSSALTRPDGDGGLFTSGLSAEQLAKNPYVAAVSRLTPSELISKFTSTAHPRVQNAVRQTVLGLIGGLPKMAFETTTITTGQRLASLMFQLQMTGYMFKNAEYRLSLQQSLGLDGHSMNPSTERLLSAVDDEGSDDDNDDTQMDTLTGKIRGKLRIRYPGSMKNTLDDPENQNDVDNSNGLQMEVDAAAYMSELRSEVSQLRDELKITRSAKEDALRKDLLLYIRTLPEKELRSLTNTMGPDVLVAMKGLVKAVMTGIGEDEIGPDTVTEQSSEAMAQLCMWQLAIGYNLRTLEVREEMKKSLKGSTVGGQDGDLASGAFE